MKVKQTELTRYNELSFEFSRKVTKHYSTSFYSATQLFSANIREAIYGIYGFVRFADEIVDSFHGCDQQAILYRFEADYDFAKEQGVSCNPVINAFLITVNKYGIEDSYVRSFLESMKSDLDKKVYKSRQETDKYIYGSADVVGLMCLCVFCGDDKKLFEELKTPAMKLGSAFQKVNFLRDLRQDVVELGRVYFPGFSMEEFDDKKKHELVRDIQSDFDEAYKGIIKLPESSRLAVLTAYRYYVRLLDKIESTPAKKLISRRIRVPNAEKFRLLLDTMIKNKFYTENV